MYLHSKLFAHSYFALILFVFPFQFQCTQSESLQSIGSCSELTEFYKTNALPRIGPYGLSRNNYVYGSSKSDSDTFPSWCDSQQIGFFDQGFASGDAGISGGNASGASIVAGGIGGNGGNGGNGGDGSSGGLMIGDAPANSQQTDPVAGVDFSETNNQVQDVDEPDIIKTDGNRVYVIRGDTLTVLNVIFGGSHARELGSLKLPLKASEMLIEGDHLLIRAQYFGTLFYGSDGSNGFGGFGFGYGKSQTVLYQVKVSTGTPILIATLRLDGSYSNSRKVNGIARLVVRNQPFQRLRFKSPSCSVTFREATEYNRNLVQNSTAEVWYPRYHIKNEADGTESSGFLSSCNNVFHTPSFSGFELLTVVNVPVSGSLKPTSSVSISSEGEVYSTATDMYITTTKYRWNTFGSLISSGDDFKTSIHKFALSSSGAQYVASGEVSGSVKNKHSMHDHLGIFYIATTDGSPSWDSRDTRSSKITSFTTSAGARKLIKAGEVGNLAVGKTIFAVRYIGNTAYLATFRRIDPIYIIDLSNPWILKFTGVLKIPGFNSYLHPIAPGRILSVGQDATPDGRITGAKVTLFSVQDKTRPTELSSWKLPDSSSNAQWDHRAFLYWKPEAIAVLPVSTYFEKPRFVGSVVLEVSETEIKERGRITHHAPQSHSGFSRIERNVVIGADHLWSLSIDQVQVNNIQDLRKESRTFLKHSNRF